jgi:hypothetical protein
MRQGSQVAQNRRVPSGLSVIVSSLMPRLYRERGDGEELGRLHSPHRYGATKNRPRRLSDIRELGVPVFYRLRLGLSFLRLIFFTETP